MLLPLLSILAVTMAYPHTTVDPSLLVDVFGTPPATVRPTNLPPRLEDITVKPTESGFINTNSNGEPCQCLPYYLCDSDLNDVHSNNASVTGYELLDVRFGVNDDCQESVERCCKKSKPYVEPTTPEPPTKRGCGYRNPHGIGFKITGGNGDEAQFGEFPWVVALLDAANGSYVGVGVLIHPLVVMTGAHVVYKYPAGGLIARAGEWDTQTTKEPLKSQERLVEDIVIKEGFHPKTLFNDMALLRLQRPLELAAHINVICLPEQDEELDYSRQCVANGWGKNVFGGRGRYAVILKRVDVDMVPFDQCANLLKRTRLGNHFQLHRSFVCAGGEEGRDTCQGDGGAPLSCPISENRYKLSGLVAWGIGCGEKDVPAAYVRVSMFRRWTDDNMLSWGLNTDGYTAY
ncbi:unnamed protein product [Danaus chrysippus]|uniref:Phenoloxidase-activating factor 2 n=1 Tax=Danaus chrysippus TaxID=151541 RepID=A0A8J2R079_9NEOP|nr:unnamed protein product [Danaus chrysippus]